MTAYSVVRADDVEDAYAGSDVPGEFRSLKQALGAEQVAVTLIRVAPHSRHHSLAPQRGRGASRDVGRLAQDRRGGCNQGR